MSVPVLTFFNNKGGVGKTSLVYHLSWMFAKMGKRVVALDLDPQANLTSAFLPDAELEKLWDPVLRGGEHTTVYDCLAPLVEVGDLLAPRLFRIAPNLHLVPGDMNLAGFEEILSQQWPASLDSGNLYRPMRVLTSFWQIGQMAASEHQADLILADVGPSLGSINRSALIGTDHVIIPIAADLFSIQGLKNLGPTLRRWREEWSKRVLNWKDHRFALPEGRMEPAGYVVLQHMERLSRPVRAYEKWAVRIPGVYADSILNETSSVSDFSDDGHCLALLKHYRSLIPMAQEARKPIFDLTAADGAIGAHSTAVLESRNHFHALAEKILAAIGE